MSGFSPALSLLNAPFMLLAAGFLLFTFFFGNGLAKAFEWRRAVGWLWAALCYLSVVLVVAPWLPLSDYHDHVFRQVRWDLLIFLVWGNIAAIVLVGLLGSFVERTFWRVDGQKVWGWMLTITLTASTGFGLFRALRILAEAPPEQHLQIAHEDAFEVNEVEALRSLGAVELPAERAALMEQDRTTYVLTKDNVIAIGRDGSRALVFARPVADLSDMLALRGMVLVVSGRTLGRSNGPGEFAKVADLPVEGLRFGQRTSDGDLSSEILLFGKLGEGGVVYGLKPDGQYLKIAEVERPVTGAAGCYESTAVAVGDKLFSLVPGRQPELIFKTPLASGQIVSVLALSRKFGDGCLYMVATADGVFGLQDGVAHILLAGVGGELRFYEGYEKGAHLADARRHAAVRISVKKPMR